MKARTLSAAGALLCTLLLASPAGAFSGAYVRGHKFQTGFGVKALLIRIACPGRTTSTGRPGDFSFCTGTITVDWHGRVVASVPFSIRTFDSHVEKVQVRRWARRLFRPHRRVQVHWAAQSHDGRGDWASRGGDIIVFNPYSRL